MAARSQTAAQAGVLTALSLVRRPWWAAVAQAVAAAWSLVYLVLGAAWLAGAPGNPADPAVDEASSGLSVLGTWGPRAGAVILTCLAGLGLVLVGVLTVVRPAHGPTSLLRRTPVALALALGLVLAVVLPDYRLLAAIAYTPIVLVLTVTGAVPEGAQVWPWPVVNMAILTLAGLAWIVTAVVQHRRLTGACPRCGRSREDRDWTRPAVAARWGKWATAIAVAIPLGYAITRYAWALGIPLGVRQQLLDDLGTAVYAGAALATLAVAGAVLTLGLVQRWGEVFPRWIPRLHGRTVPIGIAVVPAWIVSVVLASAGLMFVRLAATGELAENLPGTSDDIAGWLPEMFWPVWAAALTAAAYAYWLRRRGQCPDCGRGRPQPRSASSSAADAGG
jgi:hypothetical protein